MKRFLVLLSMVALSSSLLAGCGGGGTTAEVLPTSFIGYLVDGPRLMVGVATFPITAIPGHDTDTSGAMFNDTYQLSDGGAFLYRAVVMDPGTSASTVGEVICDIEGTWSVEDISTFEPLVRQHFHMVYGTDNCQYGLEGVVDDFVYEVVDKDAEGTPTMAMFWYPDTDTAAAPTTFAYEPDAELISTTNVYVCAKGASYGDSGCIGTCLIDFVNDPHPASGCPTLASIAGN